MKKVYLILMLVASLAVICFSTVYMARAFSKVINLSSMGDMWSFLYLNENTPYARFAEVDPDDFRGPPIPEEGDLLAEVDGLPSTMSNYFSVFNVDTPANEEIQIKFLHDSQVYETTVVTRSIPALIQIQIWFLVLIRSLIILGLIIVGLWALIKRPWASDVRSLTLFCFTLALTMTIISPAIADAYAGFDMPFRIMLIFSVFALFYPAFWLKLQLLFPLRKAVYDRHRLFINILLFAPGLIFGIGIAGWGRQYNLPLNIIATLFLTIGYVLLYGNYRNARNFLEQRQSRLVLIGSAPGILAILLFAWFVQLFPHAYSSFSFITKMVVINSVFILILFVPISLAYAFGRYKLLSVEAKLKRGTRYLTVSLVLLALFIGILYIFGNIIIASFGIETQTPTLILGLLLAFLFMPAQRKLRQKLEKHFYPERVRLRELLNSFLASNIVRTESRTFWKELEKKLAEGLDAEKIYPVLRMVDKDYFTVDMEERAPFERKDDLVQRLEKTEYPVLFDELVASGKIVLTHEQEEWFLQRKSAIILPLTTNSGLVGFLVISSKINGEDFTPEELEMLASFSAQTALVAENFELLDEKLIKQKLEEQLKVARDIQNGLLPGQIPCRRGLEIEALIRFCLDVAGDYYDVIPLDEDRTVLSIGDVAGKGVGPAMLMANLQASLRTTQEMGISLASSADQINRIVCLNTPENLFITFFMVMIDVKKSTATYVNAGHNPPLLITASGGLKPLSEGGMLLGVDPGASYEEGSIDLEAGDMILMYTDGVSEAMNSSEEEFGEKRLASIAQGNRKLPLSDLLHLIEQNVEVHHGSGDYEDDFTMLAVRLECLSRNDD